VANEIARFLLFVLTDIASIVTRRSLLLSV
jgi:hypothetical protein